MNDTWIATNKEVPKFMAYTNLGGSMALGKQRWFISSDSRVIFKKNRKKGFLNFGRNVLMEKHTPRFLHSPFALRMSSPVMMETVLT